MASVTISGSITDAAGTSATYSATASQGVANVYTTEDGSQSYTAEDGATLYTTE